MSGLQRSLGLGSLTFYGVGLILGAGIYSILGQAAAVAGEALWMSFMLGSAAALLTGLSYAELATMYPRAGAEYVYVRESWPRITWLPGTLAWVLVAAGAATTSTVSLAFAGYASLFVPFPAWTIAVALILIVVALNIVGIQESSRVNIAFTLIESAGLVALIAAGLRNPEFGSVFAVAPHAGVLGAAGMIFFAFLGFEDIANLAEEAKHPARDIPRAILIAVAISTVLYVLVAAASVTLLDPESLARSASPLADAMRAGEPRLAGMLGGVALFATANTALITVTAGSRLIYGIARGGDAPVSLAGLIARRGTPAAAVLLMGLGALVFLPLGGIGLIGSVASLLALLAFAFVNASLVRLRFTRPSQERPFHVPLRIGRWPLPTILGLMVVLLLATQFSLRVYAIAAAALALAFLVQAVPWSGANPDRATKPDEHGSPP